MKVAGLDWREGPVLGVSHGSGFEITASGRCILSAPRRVFRVKLLQSGSAGPRVVKRAGTGQNGWDRGESWQVRLLGLLKVVQARGLLGDSRSCGAKVCSQTPLFSGLVSVRA